MLKKGSLSLSLDSISREVKGYCTSAGPKQEFTGRRYLSHPSLSRYVSVFKVSGAGSTDCIQHRDFGKSLSTPYPSPPSSQFSLNQLSLIPERPPSLLPPTRLTNSMLPYHSPRSWATASTRFPVHPCQPSVSCSQANHSQFLLRYSTLVQLRVAQDNVLAALLEPTTSVFGLLVICSCRAYIRNLISETTE